MRQRRVRVAVSLLLAALLALAVACGGDDTPVFTGSDNEETAPPEAQEAILSALETMFTWSPAKDASTADAYNRALPFLGKELQEGAKNKIERGNSVWWQEWKAQKAEVTAVAKLVPAEHPKDTDDTVQRSIVMTQTVKTPDGRVLDESTFNIDRVVAKKEGDRWRVQEINFFPVNPYFTPTCPAGQEHKPAPDGPCVPITATKICPDGSSVPNGQVCPPPTTGPKTKRCDDGTTVPTSSSCPTTGTTTCPEGQVKNDKGDCVPTETPCAEGEERNSAGDCVKTETPCAEGETRNSDGVCVENPQPCPIPDQTRDSSGECQCPTGTYESEGTCVPDEAEECPSEQYDSEGNCIDDNQRQAPCPEGQSRDENGVCQYPPCPSGQTRDGNGVCQYPPCASGQTRDGNGVCQYPPCPSGQTRDGNGVCQYPPCPSGQTRDGNGVCQQPAPPPPIAANCVNNPPPPGGGFPTQTCTCPGGAYSELHGSDCYIPGSYNPGPGPRLRIYDSGPRRRAGP